MRSPPAGEVPMSQILRRRSFPASLVLALVLGTAACASGRGSGPDAEASARSAVCAGDCRVVVDNRRDVAVQVSTSRGRAEDILGIARERDVETFYLPGFRGSRLELWFRDIESGVIVGRECVSRFPRGEGRVIIGDPVGGSSGC